HSMAMSLEDIVKKYKDKNLLDALLIAYDRGCCANCRERFINVMINLKMLPECIAMEAEFDCNEDIRKLVKNYNVLLKVSLDATLLRKFYFTIEAKFRKPQPILDENDTSTAEDPIVGYFKSFGATYKSYSEALDEIKRKIEEDDADIVETDAEEDIFFDDLDEDIKSSSTNSNQEGIWYESGRAMFSDED
ncbi:MAG: hypothetical protein KC733_06775, partial [Candidatus Omnitrophica bacterium]|nr:hypothetical protein [Candidatus Omnitrophota bacterium]